MEMALYESERKYKLLIENADDPIAIVKKDGTFLLVNESGAKYFGGIPRDFNGKKMWDVFPAEQADSQMRSIKKVIETGQGLVIEEKTIINRHER
jgi:PAS domain S-box-containing protein